MNEFRTSRVDCRDDAVLQLVARAGSVSAGERPKVVRGLLWHSSAIHPNVSGNRFVDRDLNALRAINIRRCYLAGPEARPLMLQRPVIPSRLPKVVGKVIPR